MKIEDRLKEKLLYQKGFNFFKFFYFIYQYLKTKKALKQKVFYSNSCLQMLADDFFKKKKYDYKLINWVHDDLIFVPII